MTPELGALGARGLSEGGLSPQGLSPMPPPALLGPSEEQGCRCCTFARFPGSPRIGCLSLMPETSNTNNFQFAWEFQSHNPMLNNRLNASGRETGFKKKK